MTNDHSMTMGRPGFLSTYLQPPGYRKQLPFIGYGHLEGKELKLLKVVNCGVHLTCWSQNFHRNRSTYPYIPWSEDQEPLITAHEVCDLWRREGSWGQRFHILVSASAFPNRAVDSFQLRIEDVSLHLIKLLDDKDIRLDSLVQKRSERCVRQTIIIFITM